VDADRVEVTGQGVTWLDSRMRTRPSPIPWKIVADGVRIAASAVGHV